MQSVTQASRSALPWHRHADPRIVLILDGRVAEREAYGKHDYRAGEFVFRPPFHLHANDPTATGAHYVRLRLSSFRWKQLTAENAWSSARGRIDLGAVDLERLQRHEAGGDVLLDRLDFRAKRERPQTWIELQLDRLADDLALQDDQPIRLDFRAEEMGLQKYQLTRRFEKRFGMSPRAFRMEVRLSRALSLLQDGHWAMSHIAAACGFADQSHLSRTIAAATGKSPRQMQKLLQ